MRDKKTEWDGVNNNTALMHLRAMNKGDLAIIYHTGDERSAIGVAEIISQPHADTTLDDQKRVVVTLKPRKKFKHPVTLARVKADKIFAGWGPSPHWPTERGAGPQKMWNHLETLSESED